MQINIAGGSTSKQLQSTLSFPSKSTIQEKNPWLLTQMTQGHLLELIPKLKIFPEETCPAPPVRDVLSDSHGEYSACLSDNIWEYKP